VLRKEYFDTYDKSPFQIERLIKFPSSGRYSDREIGKTFQLPSVREQSGIVNRHFKIVHAQTVLTTLTDSFGSIKSPLDILYLCPLITAVVARNFGIKVVVFQTGKEASLKFALELKQTRLMSVAVGVLKNIVVVCVKVIEMTGLYALFTRWFRRRKDQGILRTRKEITVSEVGGATHPLLLTSVQVANLKIPGIHQPE
jgi:hypothetical protein